MNLAPVNKFFGAVLAFIVLIFAFSQIWFPDAFEMDDFMKFAGTVAIFYGFVAVFAMLTSGNKKDDSGDSGDESSEKG